MFFCISGFICILKRAARRIQHSIIIGLRIVIRKRFFKFRDAFLISALIIQVIIRLSAAFLCLLNRPVNIDKHDIAGKQSNAQGDKNKRILPDHRNQLRADQIERFHMRSPLSRRLFESILEPFFREQLLLRDVFDDLAFP